MAKTGNELYKGREWSKATKKEKEIIKELKVMIEKGTANEKPEKCKGAVVG